MRRRSLGWNIEEQSCTHCGHNTTGEHCQFCADGFYGDPRNGGRCEGLIYATDKFCKVQTFLFSLIDFSSTQNGFAHVSRYFEHSQQIDPLFRFDFL